MADRNPWIIAYDVAECRRLRRVRKYLAKRAFALQYSVFAADLNGRELDAIKRGLLKLIDVEKDDVRFYAAPLDLRHRAGGACRRACTYSAQARPVSPMGQAAPPPPR